MKTWFMLTVVGKDRHGIVAHLTQALHDGDCNLGEASMMRLGGNFTIMMMVQTTMKKNQLQELVSPVTDSMELQVHIDKIDGELHDHVIPNVRITVNGADQPGIVARVVGALSEAGLAITDLETDVAGTDKAPVYIMIIEGYATENIAGLSSALELVSGDDLDARLQAIDTVIG